MSKTMVTVKHKKFVSQFSMMGTLISLTLFEKNEKAVFDIYDYLQKMDDLFSANRPDSKLAEINRNAGIQPVKVSNECFSLISDAIRYSKKYSDSFNVLIGPLVKTWKIGFGGQNVPSQFEIIRDLKLVHPSRVVLDPVKQTVYLKDKGMQLDLGAIAKGYFADQIIKQLKEHDIDKGIINLGGNVQVLGNNPLSKDGYWGIGIRDSRFEDNQSAAIVHTKAKTFVTSGIKERYFKIGKKVYHHILSPQTGYPEKSDAIQVTIITDNSELAEVLSTVCFFRGTHRGKQLIDRLPNVEAIFINQKGQLITTKGLKSLGKGVYFYE
ncbi:FAD:protein FMN transferase [Lentilactobacillus hilgardii]|nr:FAD:protein FMN transferase [Lentilactobacillus hilgardii]